MRPNGRPGLPGLPWRLAPFSGQLVSVYVGEEVSALARLWDFPWKLSDPSEQVTYSDCASYTKGIPMADDAPKLPDGRPIMSSPSVPISQAAELLRLTPARVRGLIQAGELSASPSGVGVVRTSIGAYARRVAKEASEERSERRDAARAASIQEEIERGQGRRPAKGYGQPAGGMTGRPSSGGLPTLGKRH